MQKDEINCLEFVIDAISKRNKGRLVYNNIENDNYLLKMLKDVSPNPKESEFPDFLSNDAIVEHFSFTSSKDNRKGSSFKKEQSEND